MAAALADSTIEALADKGIQVVDPFDRERLQPSSIDLRLGDEHFKYDLKQYILGERYDEEKVTKEGYESLSLKHGETAFVGIYEKISIPNHTLGVIFPRSSITRLGIHIVPIYLNPGYVGSPPLTITNQAGFPIILKPGYRVAQLVLFALDGYPSRLYKDIEDAKYHEEHVEPSRLYQDKEIERLLDEIIEEKAPTLFKMIKGKLS
ncbi:MAG: dCTP deaminase [Deltaproteobacteria bacterium]|nr:dCTP deaminase [Deltaproteobacteria bacterium]